MSIQRIDNDSRRTHGWQARAYLESPTRCRPVRLTRFFSDLASGGRRKAHRLALEAEAALKREAARRRKR